ncbi:ArsR/SmtB family transcription factor [Carboxydocella thermautotrophica]|uniref:Transcriptional regulator, ArsR family n=1 Tax=Carboxydocella thermautotrophica TaxID=178899 RepID=A0A2R4MZ34_CARTR|nr:metalloregulator ArsR/SmtB family transcription factor [Carboxydocella thermautotrophica]AVX20115.1 transcriptional regulator, ArsR family [Carboxydocella thermautotrophica]AVX30532.1 transcriptional regulator, ArsR family [Carboxydocella thermautotrophica]
MEDKVWRLQADILKALAHPLRLQILEKLRQGEVCVCQLIADLQADQANISQHLAILRRQGLVSSRREGSWVHYKIVHPEVFAILDQVKGILSREAQQKAEIVKAVD